MKRLLFRVNAKRGDMEGRRDTHTQTTHQKPSQEACRSGKHKRGTKALGLKPIRVVASLVWTYQDLLSVNQQDVQPGGRQPQDKTAHEKGTQKDTRYFV